MLENDESTAYFGRRQFRQDYGMFGSCAIKLCADVNRVLLEHVG